MKNLKELLFIQQVKNCGNTFINDNVESIKSLSNYKDCVSFLKEKSKYLMDTEVQKISEKTEYMIEKLKDNNVHCITIFDEEYPEKLKSLGKDAPPVIYVLGNKSLLYEKSIAIVGTRRPSEHSVSFEKKLIEKTNELRDYVIVSGLAPGCDTIAHGGTVNCGGKTLAVLPSGIDIITPASNTTLAKKILDTNGCIVSSFMLGTEPVNYTFVRRNSIIAALSNAVIVIECGIKSGTMHTVEAANKLSRKVGCYKPSDASTGDYSGNLMLISKNKGVCISNTGELHKFINSAGEVDTKPQKQFSLL